MAPVRRVVVDVLKPHNPSLVEFTEHVADVGSVDGADVSLIELDKQVQNVAVTVRGEDVEYAAVVDAVEELGGTVHSVDRVVCGDDAADGAAGDAGGSAVGDDGSAPPLGE